MTTQFDDFNLRPELVQAVTALGYIQPTPIQSGIIPLMLQGLDVTGQAQTGTGKTAAFALPILNNLNPNQVLPQAIIVTPTRELALQATEMMEAARENVRDFIGAESRSGVLFTRGTTESMNLLASSFSDAFIKQGDEVIISGMEHHSNIVPWQIQAERKGFKIKVIPVTDDGELDMDAFRSLLSGRTRIVSVTHMSNVLGTVNPITEIIAESHRRGIPVAVDGAQSVPRMKVDVSALGADFYAFSGHKIYGPTGCLLYNSPSPRDS